MAILLSTTPPPASGLPNSLGCEPGSGHWTASEKSENTVMHPVVGNENELYIERGGPAYRVMQRLGLIRGDDPSVARRIIAFLAVTFFPLLVLSWWEGLALGPTPRLSLLLDFASFARFLVAVPLIFIAEVTIGPRITAAGLHFVRAGMVRPEDYPAFEQPSHVCAVA